MTITAAMVKELRETTGAGMMDCKKALAENNGDMEASIDWLRAKGLSKAAKKAGRTAAEGLVGITSAGNSAVVVEVNSETDFVARNAEFQTMVAEISKLAINTDGSADAILQAKMPSSGKSVADTVVDKVATIGENMSVRRGAKLSVNNGVVSTYVHNAVGENMGKIGVLVALESEAAPEKLDILGRQIAMHVAATNPASLSEDDIDPELVRRERQVLTEQARESGKPEAVIEKMIDGRMRKFLEDVTLVKQSFVINPDLTVEKAVEEESKKLGSPIHLKAFVRLEVGEGIEREEEDFAAEVQAATGS
jgi:elongation factor Ts